MPFVTRETIANGKVKELEVGRVYARSLLQGACRDADEQLKKLEARPGVQADTLIAGKTIYWRPDTPTKGG